MLNALDFDQIWFLSERYDHKLVSSWDPGLVSVILFLWDTKRMPYIKFRNMVDAHKRIPINTVVLPPLESGFRDQVEGTGFVANIMVNKSKSSGTDLVTISRAPEPMKPETTAKVTSGSGSDVTRAVQLEHNVKFLQEQHHLMLTGLHNEIDTLRHRNRELQFQLIFAKGTPSTPSSPDDETKQKLFSTSPKQINATPLQVEILEKELGELRLHVQEVDSKNAQLTLIVEEQNRKLKNHEEQHQHTSLPQPPTPAPLAAPLPTPSPLAAPAQPELELRRKLDDAEALIRRLRQENVDLRSTMAVLSAAAAANRAAAAAAVTSPTGEGGGDAGAGAGDSAVQQGTTNYQPREYHRDGGGRSHHQHRGGRYLHHRNHGNNGGRGGGGNYRGGGGGGGSGGGESQTSASAAGGGSNNWFPPLYQQQQSNYWANNGGSAARANGTNAGTSADSTCEEGQTLPSLLQSNASAASCTSTSGGQQLNQGRRGSHNNNHHYHSNQQLQQQVNGGGNEGNTGTGGHRKYHNRGHHNRSSGGGSKAN